MPAQSYSLPSSRVMNSSDYLRSGREAFWNGSYDEARRGFVRAILADPDSGYAKLYYGLSYFALGDYVTAAASLRRGLILRPETLDAPPDFCAGYSSSEAYNEHVARLRAQLERYPNDADAWFTLGFLFYSCDYIPDAVEALGKAVELDPQDYVAQLLLDTCRQVALRP